MICPVPFLSPHIGDETIAVQLILTNGPTRSK